MPRMSETELLLAIEQFEEDSLGYSDSDLAERREEALNAYTGKTLIEAAEGRSSVNSSTFRDTVLWVMPQLLRTFLGSDEVVRLEPQGPEDEPAAKQETEVIQWVSERSCPFVQFNAAFTDALLAGNGYLKVWWHSDESVEVEKYFGKSDDELAFLTQDAEVEVVEHTEYPDPEWVAPPPMLGPDGMPMPVPEQPILHDVVLRRRMVDEYARYEAVPPEEIRVAKSARSVSLQNVQFVEHRRRMTVSELREMGYNVPDEISDWYDSDEDFGGVRQARDRWDEDDWDDDEVRDPASRRVTYREAYALLDYDKDGRAERIKVCLVGRKVLNVEQVDMVPLVSISPILFGHRHVGMSLWDLLREIESIRTTLTRSYLDGLYMSINQRTVVDAGSVNVDDLLVVRPGGIIRTNGSPMDKVMPLPVSPVGDIALQGLGMLDMWKQESTGVSSAFQGQPGLDSHTLNNVNVGTVSQVISQAQMRIEAIARSFADTGIKDLFLLLHQLTLQHAKKALTVKLRNQWTVVDPRSWKKRNVVSVQVALGAGTKEMRAMQLQQLIGLQMQLAPLGVATPDKLYASFARLCNELGFKNADEFASNPAQMPPQQPPPDPLVMAQQIKSQSDLQTEQMRLQAKAQDDSRKAALEQQSAQLKVQQATAEAQLQAELEREKARVNAETQIVVARIKAEIDAQTTLQVEEMKLRAQGITANTGTQMQEHASGMAQMLQQMQAIAAAVDALGQEVAKSQQPKQIVRDARGKVVGTATQDGQMMHHVVRDANGRAAGIAPAGKLQ